MAFHGIRLERELRSTEVWTRFWNTCYNKEEDKAVYELLNRVDENPDFWLQADKGTGMTVLHLAVHFGDHKLVEKVVEKLRVIDEEDNTSHGRTLSRPTALDYFHHTNEIDRLSAVKVSGIYGHPGILECFFRLPSYFLAGIEKVDGLDLEEEQRLWSAQEEFHNNWVYSPSIREMSWFRDFEKWVEETGSKNLTTALHWAVKELGEEDLGNFVRILCGTDDPAQRLPQFLSFRDRKGRTPLHVAVEEETKCDFKQIVGILENNFGDSFDLNVPDFAGKTPLHWAAASGYSAKVSVLVQAPNTNLDATCKSKIIETPSSVWTKRSDWHKHFLDQVSGMTALHLAALHNHVEILLKADARRVNVNALCKEYIPLSFRNTRPGICGLDGSWWTPFQLAALKGHVKTLQAFLKV